MSMKRSSEAQDAGLLSPAKRNQRKPNPFPTPPQNLSSTDVNTHMGVLPPTSAHGNGVRFPPTVGSVQTNHIFPDQLHAPASFSDPSMALSNSITSQTTTNVRQPVIDRASKESTSSLQSIRRQKTGKDISISQVVAHPSWIGNIKEGTWAEDTMFIKKLVNAKKETVVFLLFGTINVAVCGPYGDYVPQFRDSISKANMKWILRSPQEQTSHFSDQITAITRLSNTIEKNFGENGGNKQRPNKSSAEFEIRCKLARKRKDGTTVIKPNDIEGENHWSVCSEAGFEPNVIQNGVFDYDGQRIGFENYQDVLKPGVNVVVAGKLQAAFFDKKPYVQIIP
ncbi:hypothetical protein BC833DRAFT_626796, partial [Globomyces pollinis-pini]